MVWELQTTEQMNLQCRIDLATKYKAGPQIRVHLRASNPPRTSFLARAPAGSAPVAASIALHDGSAEAAGVARAPPPASCLTFVRSINKGPAVWRPRAPAHTNLAAPARAAAAPAPVAASVAGHDGAA